MIGGHTKFASEFPKYKGDDKVCTKRAVKFSVDIAVEKLKKFFKNF